MTDVEILGPGVTTNSKRPSERLDALQGVTWLEPVSRQSYGAHVRVRTNDSEARARIIRSFPYGWRRSRAQKAGRLYTLHVTANPPEVTLWSDEDEITRMPALEPALAVLGSSIQLYGAEMARERVFVHAGAVGWQGRAILIPGRAHSGKSTLVAELLREGAIYYSDEYALLDDGGLIHPFARPLSIRENGNKMQRRAATFGATSGTEPIPVGLIVITQYRAGAYWRPRYVSAGKGLLALLDNAVPARGRPETVLTALQAAVVGASVVTGVRGEASKIASRILKHMVS